MKKTSTLPKYIAACSVFLTSAFININAQIVADFSDGIGSSLPDQYVGSAGDGWARSWFSLASSANISQDSTLKNTNPINNSGNYLSVTTRQTAAGGSQQNTSIGRRYTNYGDVNTSALHVIAFDLRIDSWAVGNNNQGSQFIGIYGNTTSSMGSNFTGNSTWMIRVFAGGVGNVGALTWAAYDGNRDGGSYNTSLLQSIGNGLTMELGTTYTFTIINDPTTGSYKVAVTDGNTIASTSEWLGYRTQNWGESYTGDLWTAWHQQTVNIGDGAEFSIDNVNITAIPESSTLSLVGLLLCGALLLKIATRKRR